MSAINRIGAGSPSDTASATTLAVLSIKSAGVLGNPITGIWMELHAANGSTIASWYTPINFDVVQGTQYAVYATNHLNYIFVHWEDGSTNPSRNTNSNYKLYPDCNLYTIAQILIFTTTSIYPRSVAGSLF